MRKDCVEDFCADSVWMGARGVWSWHHVLLPFPPKYAPNSSASSPHPRPSQHHLLPWWLQWSPNEPFVTKEPEWSLSKVSQILSLCCSYPSPPLPVALSTKPKLLVLTRPYIIGPLLLSPASSQVPLSFLHTIPASMVIFQFRPQEALYCLESFTNLFCVPRILVT